VSLPAKFVLLVVSASFAAWFASSSSSTENLGCSFKKSAIHPVQDVFIPLRPSPVAVGGFLGRRFNANLTNWLLTKNEDSLLLCYTHRPGYYGWQGEHVGKWIHAATLAWAYSGNAQLRAKLEGVVAKLIATQETDGYLGTYRVGRHWGSGANEQWDVWVHKFNLIGLLTYAQYTGSTQALEAAKRMGNLLIRTFGPHGSSLRLNRQGAHRGMAAGSVLEPIVLLYRVTNDERYLQFALHMVRDWEEEDGPKLISSLTAGVSVSSTANGKAYEMLSCLLGLCELFRTTGDSTFLRPVLNAWNDIVAHQLLPTGSGSVGEFWQPASSACGDTCDGVGEVCVTVSWLQLNQQLLQLTGNPRFADEIERTLYNHLTAAQQPDGSAWSYFTNLRGTKAFSAKQTCCSSSGPRGIASIPSSIFMIAQDGVVVNLFTPAKALVNLPTGDSVLVKLITDYPASGRIAVTLSVRRPTSFTLYIRIPSWSRVMQENAQAGTYHRIQRLWLGETMIRLELDIPTKFEFVSKRNSMIILRGPYVLAGEARFNTAWPLPVFSAKFSHVYVDTRLVDADGQPVYTLNTVRSSGKGTETLSVVLTPFASAGAGGSPYTVLIPAILH
jgi:hypothetical protein